MSIKFQTVSALTAGSTQSRGSEWAKDQQTTSPYTIWSRTHDCLKKKKKRGDFFSTNFTIESGSTSYDQHCNHPLKLKRGISNSEWLIVFALHKSGPQPSDQVSTVSRLNLCCSAAKSSATKQQPAQHNHPEPRFHQHTSGQKVA